ncbi:Tkp5 protein [Vanderwaltozyma polyspora DSM 70294]|uniref:Tkp5 protein n=1 Tax=Vanderwaltozyma polyspora (strain ATCC 22028 / DSM 70294 / BCRC 21397 / CBS 2163 / NBRC 10782 / NRRL Y-8283 / UCD 57-17) TaxID=436907 RepID=A7TSE5_VANPO|nr:Tkp5 protein [Vanderwaltozyma polyspora DSM 70294]EDO14807.1 Tkp5 protein [Vanderwaltozyma polyspora DSM 70294]
MWPMFPTSPVNGVPSYSTVTSGSSSYCPSGNVTVLSLPPSPPSDAPNSDISDPDTDMSDISQEQSVSHDSMDTDPDQLSDHSLNDTQSFSSVPSHSSDSTFNPTSSSDNNNSCVDAISKRTRSESCVTVPVSPEEATIDSPSSSSRLSSETPSLTGVIQSLADSFTRRSIEHSPSLSSSQPRQKTSSESIATDIYNGPQSEFPVTRFSKNRKVHLDDMDADVGVGNQLTTLDDQMIHEIGLLPNTPLNPSTTVVTRPVADIHTDAIRAQLSSNSNNFSASLPSTVRFWESVDVNL